MRIIITIKNKQIHLSLKEKGKEIDALEILEERQLSENLLPKIDELLKRNKLISQDIKKIQIESDQNDNFTTTRIAKTVANTWNWAIKF
ncbi:MAG TPA: hypothetical protein ENL05_01375 [Candidatus Moranbacteria bacterium]|nr:hypothetical protein [Candidatus Moranbacteria bacterium]